MGKTVGTSVPTVLFFCICFLFCMSTKAIALRVWNININSVHLRIKTKNFKKGDRWIWDLHI